MRFLKLGIAVIVLGLLFFGYQGWFAGKSTPPLQGRLKAALAMQDARMQEQSLVKVAKDAAAAGEVKVVQAALKAISYPEEREKSKAWCALTLAKIGKPAEASDLAVTIEKPKSRDIILWAIAAGHTLPDDESISYYIRNLDQNP
jgi:hypothetical protein